MSDYDMDGTQLERESDDEGGAEKNLAPLWSKEITQAKADFKDYWTKCDQICKRYKGDHGVSADQSSPAIYRRYNVLWSIVQTLQPLVYSKPPKPFVSRRFNDGDPVARDASTMIQRATAFSLQGNELHDALLDARDDYLLCGRGVIWPKYSPYMQLRTRVNEHKLEDESAAPEGVVPMQAADGSWYYEQTEEYEEKVYEETDWEHIHYRDFLHGASAKWKHVPWVARRVPMTRKNLVKRFGKEMGRKPPLTITTGTQHEYVSSQAQNDEEKGLFAKAEIWEIWDKENKKVYWLCPDYPKEFLDERDDFLELDGFFPCPRPIYGTKTNDSLVPTPDFCLWQDIAIELDDLTHRIKILTESLRVVGVYDKSAGEVLGRLFRETLDNDMIPVDNWAMFGEKGGISSAVEFFPIDQIAGVLQQLVAQRQGRVQELYEITGVSDIIRGANDPRETAKAAGLKGQYANKRLGTKEDEIIRMADEALEIHAEIMSKHYSDKTLRLISSANETLIDPVTRQPDQARFDAAVKLIRSTMRQQRIKVDERSLVEEDVAMEQMQRSGIVDSLTGLLSIAAQAVGENPDSAPLMSQLLMFAVRGFPMAASEESGLQSALDGFVEKAQQPKPPAEPDPIEGAKLEIEKQRLAIEQQKAQAQQAQIAFEKEKSQLELQLRRYEIDRSYENRKLENELRQRKMEQEGMLRVDQIESQERAQEQASATSMNKAIADLDEKARQFDQAQETELMKWIGEAKLTEQERETELAKYKREQARETSRELAEVFGFGGANGGN